MVEPRILQPSLQFKTRTAHFQPILCDRLKIYIDEGATEIQGALEILGMPLKKVYHADPIFEPRTFETELFMGVANSFNVDVLDR